MPYANATLGYSPSGSYAVPFPYLSTADVAFSVAGAAYAGSVQWTGAQQVSLSPNIDPAAALLVQRTTPRDAMLTTFRGGPVYSADLNTGFTQLLYIAQEQQDAIDAGGADPSVIAAAVAAALPSALATALPTALANANVLQADTGTGS